MATSVVWILWPASAFFAVALGFQVGAWWNHIHQPGRHQFMPRRNEADDASLDEDERVGHPTAEPQLRPTDNADTEVLPRVQDIRPPIRATPIRRPPWVKTPARTPRNRP